MTASIVPAPLEQTVDAAASPFLFTASTRVVATSHSAAATAALAAEQLSAQLPSPIATAGAGATAADVVLTLVDDSSLGAEGYRLAVGDGHELVRGVDLHVRVSVAQLAERIGHRFPPLERGPLM